MEEALNSEVAEVAPQDEAHVVQESPVQQVQAEESRQERNWREMRQRYTEMERELRATRELNNKILENQMELSRKKEEPDETDTLQETDWVNKGHLQKIVGKEKQAIIKETVQELEKIQKAKEDAAFLDRLRRQYTDFNDVVNVDTMRLLEEHDPELASTIADLKDPYKIGVQTYKYIKAMNLAEKVPSSRRAKEIDKKIESNAKTVQSPQAYDKRPMAVAFKMTEDQKSELYKEMIGYARMAGSGY